MDAQQPNLRLADLFGVLRRRWRWVVITTVLITGLALGASLAQKKSYEATARVLVRTPASETGIAANNVSALGFFPDRQLQNTIQVVKSVGVRAKVAAAYGGPLAVDSVTAAPAADLSDSVDISARAADPQQAADLVNLYAKTYIAYAEQSRIDTVLAAIDAINKQVAALDSRRSTVQGQLDDLTAKLAADPNNGALQNEVGLESSQLKTQLDAIDSQRNVFLQSLQNLNLSQDLASTLTAELVSEATPPKSPVTPKPARDGVIGLMLGLGLGLGLALSREFVDESLRSVADLERLTSGAPPTLGAIPAYRGDGVITATQPGSAAAEAYRGLRTSVRFLDLDGAMKVVQVTSPRTGDGKTTTIANLGVALAQAGHRVVVVSSDLRRPTLHKLFGVRLSPGLTDVLLGESQLSQAVQETSSGVYVLSAGAAPPNPSEMLGSKRMDTIVEYLAGVFDYVLIDSPPVLPVTDAIVVSRLGHGVIVVAAARTSSRHGVRHALNQLAHASAPVIGVLLTKVPSGGREGYDYLYADTAPPPKADDEELSGRAGRRARRASQKAPAGRP